VAAFLEVFTEFAIVVDLAVKNNPRGAVGVVNRLLPALEINDRKTPHRQPHAVAHIETILVRAAMMNGLVHTRQQLAIDRRAITANVSCYATHLFAIEKFRIG
jgi:hypothetical protein